MKFNFSSVFCFNLYFPTLLFSRKSNPIPERTLVNMVDQQPGTMETMSSSQPKRPNIIFIMADDHASKAIGCYGAGINHTPNIDRLATEGMKFNHCYVTNSICTPSRASILTGTYNHVNGVMTLDNHVSEHFFRFLSVQDI